MTKTVVCVVGTRPEVIKMAPVVTALRAHGLRAPVLATAQHRGMLDQAMAVFGLRADWDLDLMRDGQALPALTARMLPALDRVLGEAQPDAVLAQGDTVTVFCSALAAFYRHLPFGHVEAGLRSGDLAAPFPEEALRRLTCVLAHWHFAPTARARGALLREGVAPEAVRLVGNTVIDALLATARRTDLPEPPVRPLASGERLVLVTLHRRENFGAPLQRILGALRTFCLAHPEARVVYPVHPNPNVSGPARKILGGLPGVELIEPQDYPVLVHLMQRAELVCTDSGGIQEEAPALGKPVLVFRDVTERPEAVEAGGVLLVGSDPAVFAREAERLWTDPEAYRAMAVARFPYGNGTAAQKIAETLARDLGAQSEPALAAAGL